MGNAHPTGRSDGQGGRNEPQASRGAVEYAALEELLQNVRSDRVREQFYKIPESQYTDTSEIRVWASTFNLNGRKPPEDLDLGGYLQHWQSSWPKRETDMGEGSYERADVYIMGFQEAVPLTAQNVIASETESTRGTVCLMCSAGWTAAPAGWDNAIDRCLNPWKTEEEIVRSPKLPPPDQASLIAFYDAGWSGTPSGNLDGKVKSSLAAGMPRQTALLRRGSSFECARTSSNDSAVGGVVAKSTSFDAPDLISFDSKPDVPGQKHASTAPKSKEKQQSTAEAAKEAVRIAREKRKETKHEEFLQLFGHQLVGLYVTGWVRKSLVERISGVQVTTVATGALGYLANKGAISIRFRIDDSAFVFVTSHLASGSSEGDQLRRNLDFSEIVRRTRFPFEVELVKVTRDDGTIVEDFSSRPEGIPDDASYEVKRAFVGGKWGTVRSLRDLDNIIWVGDLNYRINGQPDEVIQLIRADKLNFLLEVDQLSIERAAGNVFQDFLEAPIDFPPTYKFVRGTGYYTGEVEEDASSDSDEDVNDKGNHNVPGEVISHPLVQELPSHLSVATQKAEARGAVGDRVKSAFLSPPPAKPEFSSFEEDMVGRRGSAGDIIATHEKEEKIKKKKKKIRTPAWTDRILWYSSKKQLHQLLYGSFASLHVSDHKPVVATFLMEARKFSLLRVESSIQEARRSIDVEEMASIPRCKVMETVIALGNVQYGNPIERGITIQNIGEVPAVYSFIPANPGRHVLRSPFPTWLSAQPTSGVIRPGKKEQVQVTISIEGGQWGSADELFGDHENKLDHILVIHVEGGSDFFVSIVGTYTLSCFGLSLNNLALQLPHTHNKLTAAKMKEETKLPSMRYRKKSSFATGWEVPVLEDFATDLDQHPITLPTHAEGTRLQKSSSLAATGARPNLLEGPTGLMIPSQVSRMLHFLAESDRLKTPHIFVESLKQLSKALDSKTPLPAVEAIRDALDQATCLPSGTTTHDMASALFVFFMDLPSPLIPESVAQSCEMSDISAVMAMSLLKEAMSAIEWSVFDSTIEIMKSVLMEENVRKNHVQEEELARVLSQIFFQDISKPPKAIKTALHLKEAMGTPSRKAAVENRRCMFIQQFLKLTKPLIDLDDITPSEISYRSS